MRLRLPVNGTSFYGLGEIAGSLLLNDLFSRPIQPSAPFNDDYTNSNDPQIFSTDLTPSNADQINLRVTSNDRASRPNKYKQNRSRAMKEGITVCWNTDVGVYSQLNPSLYQSHPFLLAVLADGSSIAMYLDSTYRSIVHMEQEEDEYQISFLSEGQSAPGLYVSMAQSPQEIAHEIGVLFGAIALPPKWALGYHQCRYSYYPDREVLRVAQSFRLV